jgi:hypothetical protein
MKNSKDTVKNRSRNLPACSTVSQPTALPRAPVYFVGPDIILYIVNTPICFDAFVSSSVSLILLLC